VHFTAERMPRFTREATAPPFTETSKAKVVKARAFVEQRQRETMSVVRRSLVG